MSVPTTQLGVSCSCGATSHRFSVPTSSLPLSTHLCSCDISRRISGSLLTSYVNITHEPNAPKPDTTTCTPYNSSTILRRWFCSTCGTHMYLEYHKDGHFEAATGTLQVNSSDDIVKHNSCMWIQDTLDGGASRFITNIRGTSLERWYQEPGHGEQVPLKWTTVVPPSSTLQSDKRTYGHCHCRGVEFWITPPDDSSRLARSPFPDLQIPYHLDRAENPRSICWWVEGGNRYLAGTCSCHSCRRASGFDMSFWAFVPTSNIFLDESCSIAFPTTSGAWGSMKTYASSRGVTRSFCSACGANVFWQGDRDDHGREGLIDVAVGLLDSPSGARAEDLLAWWPNRVSFAELALHRGLVLGMQDGLSTWGQGNDEQPYVAKGKWLSRDLSPSRE